MTYAFLSPVLGAATSVFSGHSVRSRASPRRASVNASVSATSSNGAKKPATVAKGIAASALMSAALVVPSTVGALTKADIAQLSYGQVKGTGLANRCPEVESNGKVINLQSGKSYRIVDLCLEPKSFKVEEEVQGKRKGEVAKSFVDTKLMTRATYTLTGVEGPLTVGNNELVFEEKDGIDYAATTVQLPGGERVPFLFTVKNLIAKASGSSITTATEFGGEFRVPSYRSGLFLDPKGRGGVTGYDMAVGLPAMNADGAEGQDELYKETNKVFQVTDGAIEMAVQRVDADSGELAGVFVSEQLSDTDMGAKAPKKVLLTGIFYGRVDES